MSQSIVCARPGYRVDIEGNSEAAGQNVTAIGAAIRVTSLGRSPRQLKQAVLRAPSEDPASPRVFRYDRTDAAKALASRSAGRTSLK